MPIKLVFTCNATQDEEIIIVGSHGCLGEWNLSAGLRMSGFPHAYGACLIEKPTKIEFKAVRKKGSTTEWELADMNRVVNVKAIPTLYIDFDFNDPSIRLLDTKQQWLSQPEISQKTALASIFLPKQLDNDGNFYDSSSMPTNTIYARMLNNKTNFYWHGISDDDKNISKYKDTRMVPIAVNSEVIEKSCNFMEAIDTHLAGLNNEDIFSHELEYQHYKQLCKALAIDILKGHPENIVITDEQLWLLPIYILKDHQYAPITFLFQKEMPPSTILGTLPYWEKMLSSILLCSRIVFQTYQSAKLLVECAIKLFNASVTYK